MNIPFGKLEHSLRIGQKGKIGIMGSDNGVVFFAALIVDDVCESPSVIRQAIIETFHPPFEENVSVSVIAGGSVMCLFQRAFEGQVRNPESVCLNIQRGFLGMLEQLRESEPNPC